MKHYFALMLALVLVFSTTAQQTKKWSDADRIYLKDNLTRTKELVISETKGLSKAQWNFKESPDRWSINQVVEHIAIWELLLQREISMALLSGERPGLIDSTKTDSSVLGFLMEEKQHISTEYTQPFTFTVPLGTNDGTNNLAWFLKMRNEGIGYVDTTSANLRNYLQRPGRGNVHQVFITIFGHTDRHLKQIRRVKADPKFPKK